MKLALSNAVLITIACLQLAVPACLAKQPQQAARPAATNGGGIVYPQCLYQGKVARWIREQMPIRVWVSHGLSLDNIIDPATGAPVTNTANTAHWGDAVADVLDKGQLNTLPIAEQFNEDQYRAAVQGLMSWKSLENEGLFAYGLTDNPDEADIYVFWTHHFVNKLGLGLFENDIRGQTSKWLLPAQAVISAMQKNDIDLIRRSRKPVVILLRTTQQDGTPVSLGKMQAASAHEMGHALGIDGHSPYAADLMSLYYGKGVASGNDLATMRWLYRRPADMIP